MGKLRMGFIGSGFIGPVHARSVAMLHNIAEVYAVADDDPKKREQAENQGLVAYPSAEELIADKNVDTIHITGPDNFHADWAIQAMGADKRVVVCEKPMTETLDDAVSVLECAQRFESEGGVFMTNINYMGHALPRAARQLVQQGELGDIKLVKASYEQDWLMDPNVWNWRVEGDRCASKDILPHLVSAAYFMAGIYPTSVIADSATIVSRRYKPTEGRGDAFGGGEGAQKEPVEVFSDLYASVLCDFNNGGKGNLMVTQYIAGRHNWWEITLAGTERSITWNQTDPNRMEIGQRTFSGTNPGTYKDLGNILLINNPGNLKAMGFEDAAEYSPYPGEHPAGHIDAFANNFRTAYLVATGAKDRKSAVIAGATIGFMCVAVADAVLRSMNSGARETVDYRGADLKGGKL